MARGQIIQRKSGFTVRIFTGRDAKGKRQYHNQRVTGNKKEAQKVLTALLQKLDTGELLFNPSQQTLKDYLEEWLETIAKTQVARSTFKTYCHAMQSRIYPTVGKRKLNRLEPKEVQKIYNALSESGLAPATVVYTHNVLSSALKHAVGQRMIPSNPCDHVKLPKRDHKEMNALTEEEALRLREAARLWDVERQDQADRENRHVRLSVSPFNLTFFSLLLDTGLRPSEALALKWKDLDIQSPIKSLRIVRTLEYVSGKSFFKEPKTKRSKRTIELLDETVSLLLNYKPIGANDDELIFTSLEGTALSRDNVRNRHFKPCMLRAGLATEEKNNKGNLVIKSKFRLYDLRHTHATILLRANVNPKIVSERLGHASVSLTLDTYSHVLPTMQGSAVAAIGNALYKKDEEPKVLALN